MNGVSKKLSRRCSVPNCNALLSNNVFHKFPKDENFKQEWINVCNITKPVTYNSFICASHFVKEDYASAGSKRLHSAAIPSKNLIHDFEEFIPEEELQTTKCSPVLLQNDANVKLSELEDINESQMLLENIVEFVPVEDEDVTIIATHTSQNPNARVCCIAHCKSTPDKKRYQHYFPKQKNLRQMWKNACQLGNDETIKNLTVCSAHFKKSDYIRDPKFKKSVLKATAVPSLNLHNNRKRRLPTPEIEIITNEENGEGEEKVTTIIYVPANCKEIISRQSNTFGILKNNNSTSLLKKNQSPELSNVQKNVIQTVQVSEISPSSLSVEDVTSPNSSGFTIEQYVDNSQTISKIRKIENNAVVSNQNAKIINKKRNSLTAEANNQKPILKHDYYPKVSQMESKKNNLTAGTLCIECGQQCKVDNLNSLNIVKKNVETIAAETLLELQEINFSSEQERMVLTKKGIEICDKTIQRQSINLSNLLQNDNELEAFTGINLEILDKLVKLVTKFEGKKSLLNTISVKDRIVISLCKLRTDLPFRSISVLFGISEKVCIAQFFSLIKILSLLLQKTIYWTKTDELLKDLPKCFQSFKQTRVILNCSELQVEKPKCAKCLLALNFQNKEYDTIKLILGIAPSGLIILKSNVFKNEMSDISLFEQIKLLDYLDPAKDAIMADKSLNIEAECLKHNVILIKLPKIEQNKRFTKQDVEVIKNIAAARIHVERTIQRFKMYKILQSKISLKILPYIDDVCTIIAGVVNMKNPIPPNELQLSDDLKEH